MTTALEGGEGSASRPGRFLPPAKTRYPLYGRLGGPQGRSGQVRKILPPPVFDPRIVQPVASRYTDYATRPTTVEVVEEYWRLWRLTCRTRVTFQGTWLFITLLEEPRVLHYKFVGSFRLNNQLAIILLSTSGYFKLSIYFRFFDPKHSMYFSSPWIMPLAPPVSSPLFWSCWHLARSTNQALTAISTILPLLIRWWVRVCCWKYFRTLSFAVVFFLPPVMLRGT